MKGEESPRRVDFLALDEFFGASLAPVSRDWLDDWAVDDRISIFVEVEADSFLYIPYCEVEGCTECPRSGVVRGIRWERVDATDDTAETPL